MPRPLLFLVIILQFGSPRVLVGSEPRTDRYGDPLPDGAIARLGTVRYRWSAGGSVMFAPDGKTLFSIAGNSTIRVWAAATGKLIRAWPTHQHIYQLAVSPDCKIAATTGEDGIAVLWDVATGRQTGRFHASDKDEPWELAFSRDGRTLALGRTGGTITLVKSPSGEVVRHFTTAGDNPICSLAFTPDGRRLASGHHSAPLRLWDVKTGEEVRRFDNQDKGITKLRFTPDGKFLLSDGWPGEQILRVWETATGRESRRFTNCDEEFVILPEGKEVATYRIQPSGRRIISLRRLDNGEEVRRLTGHQGRFGLALCCPDDKTILSFGDDLVIRRWDTASGRELTERRPELEDTPRQAIKFVAFSPDGKTVLSADSDFEQSTLRFWDPATAAEIRRLTDKKDYSGTRVLSPDGKLSAAVEEFGSAKGRRARVRLLDVSTGTERRSLPVVAGWLACLCFSRDGKVLFAGAGKTLRFWNVADGTESRPAMTNEEWGVIAMACSPDGRTLALAHDLSGLRETTALTLLDLTTGQQKEADISDASDVYQSVAFSPDGRFLAVGGRHGRVYLFDIMRAETVKEFSGGGECLAFSPDGRLLATTGWGKPNSRVLGIPLAGAISLWEVETGQQRCRFTGHLAPVERLAFSPDGRLLVSGSLDTSLMVWDAIGVARSDPTRNLSACWDDLGAEGERVHRAIGDLVAAGDRAVAFFQKRMPLLSSQDKKHIAELIAALDHERFAEREKATKELAALGVAAVPDLLRALEGQPSPEVRRRVEQLVEKPRREEKELTSAPALRTLRAIEVLEHIGNSLAQRILRDLSERGPDVLCRHEAQGALRRLTQKAPATP